jgi:glycogen debranching enzyme
MLAATTAKSVDLKKFKAFVIEKALTSIHQPDGMLPYRFVTPTYGITPGADDLSDVSERSKVGHYLQMYDWDACLFSQAQSYLGLSGLAADIVSNFLSLEKEDGYIPRTVSPHRIWDGADVCKPLMSQALLKEHHISSSPKGLSTQILQSLDHYLDYFNRNRRHVSGLYHWRNMLESGVDDNFALIYPLDSSKDENTEVHGYPDGRLLAVDISSWLVAEYNAFSQLATLSGWEGLSSKYSELSVELSKKIEDMLWDEELSMYCNFDPVTQKYARIRSWTGLMPVALGFAKPDRAKQTIENCIMNELHFLRPAGLASVAASDELYNQSKLGLYGRAKVANWQGPVWVIPNVLVIRGMLHYGFEKEARELALRILTTLVNAYNKTGTMNENYNAETGAPLRAPNFMSWNVLCLELMRLVE